MNSNQPKPAPTAEEQRTIQLSNGGEAIVDASDWPSLSGYKWRKSISGSGHISVVRTTSRRDPAQPWRPVSMHRQVLGVGPGVPVDHINRNTLDNRRANLRICTDSQNQHNRGPQKQRQFKGTIFDKRRKSWRAALRANGISVSRGPFATEEEAARAYDALAREKHGAFAYQNFGESQ